MVKSRYVHTIALDEELEARVKKIQAEDDSISLMDIFKMGVDHAEDYISRK